MKLQVIDTKSSLAETAALFMAEKISQVLAQHPTCNIAFSGGSTPALMLDRLSELDIDWSKVIIFQVDERVAPDGSPERNATQLKQHLLDKITIPSQNIHLAPVGSGEDLETIAREYEKTFMETGGQIDVLHLGLGDDGHTASLPPEEEILNVSDKNVWYVPEYKGLPRISLTYPALNSAKHILWLVSGSDKVEMLKRLMAGDAGIPAGQIEQSNATALADADASKT